MELLLDSPADCPCGAIVIVSPLVVVRVAPWRSASKTSFAIHCPCMVTTAGRQEARSLPLVCREARRAAPASMLDAMSPLTCAVLWPLSAAACAIRDGGMCIGPMPPSPALWLIGSQRTLTYVIA